VPFADSVLKKNIAHDEGFEGLSPQAPPETSPMATMSVSVLAKEP